MTLQARLTALAQAIGADIKALRAGVQGNAPPRIEVVGITAYQQAATLTFPSVAQAGDLALLAAASTVVGYAPPGWSAVASGSSLVYYRICTGGEASVARPSSSGGGVVALFRPVSGAIFRVSGTTQSPVVTTQLDGTASPGLLIAAGNSLSSAVLEAPAGMAVLHINEWLLVAAKYTMPGEKHPKLLVNSTPSGSSRQTFGLFGIS